MLQVLEVFALCSTDGTESGKVGSEGTWLQAEEELYPERNEVSLCHCHRISLLKGSSPRAEWSLCVSSFTGCPA